MKLEPSVKSLAAAIGLNLFLLPGSGYIYMGRPIRVIVSFVMDVMVLAIAPDNRAFVLWGIMNLVMAIDMAILLRTDMKRFRRGNSRRCSSCAEVNPSDATRCRSCNSDLPLPAEPSLFERIRDFRLHFPE